MELSNLHVGDLIEQRYSDFEEGLMKFKMVFKTRKGIITYSPDRNFRSVQWLSPYERGVIFTMDNVTLLSRAQEKKNDKEE